MCVFVAVEMIYSPLFDTLSINQRRGHITKAEKEPRNLVWEVIRNGGRCPPHDP